MAAQTQGADTAWREQVARALVESGQRRTVPRQAILDWMAVAGAPFSAEQVVAALEQQQGISSRSTIYRLIDWLVAQGWLTRIYNTDELHTYVRTQPGHHHMAVCTQCGATQMISDCAIEASIQPVLAATNFEVHGHMLELYGVCGQCRAALARDPQQRGSGPTPLEGARPQP